MNELNHGQEPVDLKLLALRLMYRIQIPFLAFLLGAMVTGLSYYAINHAKQMIPTFQVTGDYQITYAEEAPGVQYVSFNEPTWNTLLQTEEFTDIVISTVASITGTALDREQVINLYQQVPMTDVRIMRILTKTEDENLSLAVAQGVDIAMRTYPDRQKDIAEVKVLTDADLLKTVYVEQYLVTATLSGGFICFFFALFIMIFIMILDSRIYIPKTIELRYQIPVFGMLPAQKFMNETEYQKTIEWNLLKSYFVNEKECSDARYLCAADKVEADAISRFLADTGTYHILAPVMEMVEEIRQIPENAQVILLVPFGVPQGPVLERTISVLRNHQIQIAGALLIEVNPNFMKQYYGKKHSFQLSQKGVLS